MSNSSSNEPKDKITRRDLLKTGAVVGAGIVGSTIMPATEASAHGHVHTFPGTEPPPDIALRVKALESLLVQKKIVAPEMLDYVADRYQNKVGPQRGKKIVAMAWSDPKLKEQLINARPATDIMRDMLKEELAQVPAPPGMKIGSQDSIVVLENTPKVHNLVVCTLCSCYPWAILGLPPVWYKSAPYRSRAVSDPRAVLAEFGTVLDEDVEIRVWDTNSEMWYLVLPERPEGTEGWSVEKLMELVTVESMVGVEKAKNPKDIGGN